MKSTSHVPQVVAQGHVGLTRFQGVDDRVRSEVQHALLKLLQVRVQLETIVAGGESGDEDVRAFVVGLILFEVGVDDLNRVIVSDPDLTYVEKGMGDERENVTGVVDGFGCCFE